VERPIIGTITLIPWGVGALENREGFVKRFQHLQQHQGPTQVRPYQGLEGVGARRLFLWGCEIYYKSFRRCVQAEAKCTSREGLAGVSRGGGVFTGALGVAGVFLLSCFMSRHSGVDMRLFTGALGVAGV